MADDMKDQLHGYLREAREALWWKLEGLSERELRWPRTGTGTNLLGIVRHCANVELGYFGPTFGREWPDPDAPGYIPEEVYDDDPQADWWVPAGIPAAELVTFHRRVAEFADETISSLPLEARGRVPWWPEGRGDVTLHRVLVHVLTDLARHAGHADILREQEDGSVGMRTDNSNVPRDVEWASYVEKLRRIAEQFPSTHR